jgi:hypothetical protein
VILLMAVSLSFLLLAVSSEFLLNSKQFFVPT